MRSDHEGREVSIRYFRVTIPPRDEFNGDEILYQAKLQQIREGLALLVAVKHVDEAAWRFMLVSYWDVDVGREDAIRRSAAATPAPSNAMARTLRLARQSGSLNLSSRDLQSFPDEVFRLYELLDEDERSWECAVLRKLDLRCVCAVGFHIGCLQIA
ncbi:hypothetical protein PR003_g16583 [Phytophthora rubi]|uniref:Uncharacterized protein n=1 Tax=Phytophthora rubi TaxID=129364 RepID=A0A6A4EFD0_9STRA|nr:hypothetical protein PR003_g16583 [Phytophthora rubi]